MVMSLPDKFIVFLGRTFSGHNHDYIMLKQEFPPELDWFTDINIRIYLDYIVFDRTTVVIGLTSQRRSLARVKRTLTLTHF